MLDTITALEEKINQDPFDIQTIRTLGEIYFNQSDYVNSAKTYSRIINLDHTKAPDIIIDFEKKLVKESGNIELLLSLIELHVSEGVIRDVLEEISICLDIDPNNQHVLDLLLQAAHKYKEPYLIPVLEKAVKLNVNNSSLFEVLAGVYFDKGDLSKAISLYEEAVYVDKNNLSAWLVLAELYVEFKDESKSFMAYKKGFSLSSTYESLIAKLEKTIEKVEDKIPFLYLLAKAYIRSIKPDSALEKYREILTINKEEVKKVTLEVKEFLGSFPDYPEGNFLFAEAAMLMESYSEAITLLKKVIESTPQYTDRVIDYLQKIIRLCPNQVYAYQTLGDIYLVRNDYVNCLNQFDKMIDIIPEEADFVIERARSILQNNAGVVRAREVIAKALLGKRQYKRAIAEAEAIIALDQNNAGAYLVLARAHMAEGEIEFSKNGFKTALQLNPYNRETHIHYRNIMHQNLDRKIFEISKDLEKDPWKYSIHYNLGTIYFQRGLLKEAIGEFQIAVKDAEKAYDIHKLQGLCFKEMGRFDLAIVQYEKALEHLPEGEVEDWKKIKFYIGLAYESQGEHKKALGIYEDIMTQDIDYENIQLRMEKLKSFSWVEIRGKALAAILADYDSKEIVICWAKNSESDEFNKKNNKKNVDVSFSLEHNNKAVEHTLKGRLKAAEDEFELAAQMDPQFTIVYNNLAVLAMKNGDFTEARRLFDLALTHNNKLPIVYANYAVLLYLEKEDDLAKEYYDKALAFDDSMFVTQINMGDLYYFNDDVEKAIVYWDRALSLGVLPELAKRRLMYRSV